ncbi:MAG: hypothetical protein WBA73_21885 [Devosia sp.]
MINNHFVISQRESVWQFSFRGDVTGPFTNKDAAVNAAIEAASKLDGDNVEVVVHDADLRAETVWRSNQTSGG